MDEPTDLERLSVKITVESMKTMLQHSDLSQSVSAFATDIVLVGCVQCVMWMKASATTLLVA